MVRSIRLRAILRWSGITLTGFLGAYVYSVLYAGHPVWTDAARYGVLPLFQLSSVRTWIKARVAQRVQPLHAIALAA